MQRIRVKDLIKSKEYVREPVDKEINNILESKDRKIILTGGRGTGRSTVLCGLENRGLGSKEQTIYDCPDGVITLSKEPDERYNEKLFDYLYELHFANNLLIYIKNNYPIAFEKYFKKDKELVNNYLDNLYDQMNNSFFENVNFDIRLVATELSQDILRRIRHILEIERLNLAMDRFDRINGSSEYVQKLYERYFDMFDKTLIISDDPKIDKERLSERGYATKQITYGNDKEVLREIIRRRIQLHNRLKNNQIDLSYSEIKRLRANGEEVGGEYEQMEKIEKLKNQKFSPEELFVHDVVIDRLNGINGNIDLALDVIEDVNDQMVWKSGKSMDIEETIKESIEYRQSNAKKLDKIMAKPKLYL